MGFINWCYFYLESHFNKKALNLRSGSYQSRLASTVLYGVIPGIVSFILFVLFSMKWFIRYKSASKEPKIVKFLKIFAIVGLILSVVFIVMEMTFLVKVSKDLKNAIGTSYNNVEMILSNWKITGTEFNDYVGEPGQKLIENIKTEETNSLNNQKTLEIAIVTQNVFGWIATILGLIISIWIGLNLYNKVDNKTSSSSGFLTSTFLFMYFGVILSMSLSTMDICTGINDEDLNTYSLFINPISSDLVNEALESLDQKISLKLDDLNSITGESYTFENYNECNPENYPGNEQEVQELINDLDNLKILNRDLRTYIAENSIIFSDVLDKDKFCKELPEECTEYASSLSYLGIVYFLISIVVSQNLSQEQLIKSEKKDEEIQMNEKKKKE